MSQHVPERIQAAVDALEVRPGDRLLEIGCGSGAAISLVAGRLVAGRIDAIDRSAVAVERALRRNAEHVAAGRARIRRAALEELEPGDERYDAIFAIDVNHFWTGDPARELSVLRRLLEPAGTLFLFYDGTAATANATAIVDRITTTLRASGFSTTLLDPPLLGISAVP